MLLFLTCEDKKKERDDFGSISINIIFENQATDSPVNDSESDHVIEDSKVNKDSLKQFFKEGNQKTEEENENKDNLVALKKEKTSLFSSVKYVKIIVGELQPVEINISGSTATTTIDDIPAGPQSVSIQLLNSDKLILYQETKSVTIVAGETATPTFNDFKVANESLELLKPNGGESFKPGDSMSIEWVGSHDNIPIVLDLYNNNAKKSSIQSSTINDGYHAWKVPAGLSPSISYQIKITSTNNASVSDYSDNHFSVADVVAPAVPSGLSATAGDKQVVLTWSANSESDLKSYKVYGGTSASPTALLSTVNAGTETYTHTSLTNGTTYYYRISAVDNSGNESSKTSDVSTIPDDGPPAKPTGLVATAGDKQVVLTWSANSESDLKSYKVYGGTSASPTALLSTVNAGTETYTHTSLTNGTTYYYRISAVDNSGNESEKTGIGPVTPSASGGGNALSFDGADDDVIINNNISAFSEDYTINFFFKAGQNDYGTAKGLIGKAKNQGSMDGWQIFITPDNGGELLFNFGSKYLRGPGKNSFSDDKWHYVTIVYSSSNDMGEFYFDGTRNQNINNFGSYNDLDSNIDIFIGRDRQSTSTSFFNGKIDEFSIWNKALSKDEIVALYNSDVALDARTNSGNYTSSDNLKGYWKMEDGSGTTLTDVSGYGSDGTIDGANWATGVLSTSYDNTPKVITGGEAGTYSLSFDGADDYATTTDPSSTLFTNGASHTLELWYKTSTVHGEEVEIIGNYDRSSSGGDTEGITSLYLANTGNVLFRAVGADQINSTTAVADGKWHHIACVYDVGNMKNYLFIDGTKEAEGTISSVSNFGNANNEFHVSGGFSRLSAGVTRYNAGIVNVVRVSDVPRYTASFTPALSFSSDNNTKALWNMSEGSGTTVADASGNNNHLTISGASWVTDVPTGTTPSGGGNALSFDGDNDNVQIANQSMATTEFGNNFSFSTWAMVTGGAGTERFIITNGGPNTDGYLLFATIENNFRGILDVTGSRMSEVNGSTTISLNTWYHITLVYNASSLKLYVNGQLDGENSNASGEVVDPIANSTMYIGSRKNPDKFFPGKIDEFSIWNDALTSSEVTALYNSGTALDARTDSGDYASTVNLKGYWKMEDGSGTTLTDVSGYGNDGTIDGASWATGVLSTSYDNTPKVINNSSVTVKTDGTGDYTSIQSAIDAVSSGGTITVYDGTYKVNDLTIDNKTVTIRSANGKSSTIIDGESQNRIMTIKNNDSHTFTLDGFTITNGHALSNSGYVISAENGTNSFKNLILENSGQNTGNTLFRGNHRDSTTFEACIIRNNKSENSAGIGDATVINCLIYGNSGWNNTSPVLRCNVINSTIVNNGGGASNAWTTGGISHSYLVVNSIIRGNGGAGQIYDPDNTMTLSYSNTPGYSGNGIINADPLFVNESNHDYHLQDGSPCIAAGTTTNAPLTDLDGNTRPAPSGTNPDMGAYENSTISGAGNALSFDGTDDYAQVNYSSELAINGPFTASAWVKIPTSHSSNWGTVIGARNGLGILLYAGSNNADGKATLELNSSIAVTGTSDLRDNKWHYVTGIYDGTATKIYVDGALQGSTEGGRGVVSGTDNFYIGRANHSAATTEHFPGNIDEVAIWNDALTQAEVTALYNSGTALDTRTNSGDYASTANLVGYWKMEDGSGTKLTDVSGYGNDGTIDGASWTTGVLSTSYDNTPKTISGGNALSFDGTDDYVAGSNMTTLHGVSATYTISSWAKLLENSGNQMLWAYDGSDVGEPDDIYMYWNGSRIRYATGCPGHINTCPELSSNITDLGDNQWHHIVYVKTATQVLLYEDGILKNTENREGGDFSNAYTFRLADNLNASHWNGLIDEVAMWNEGLTSAEVSALYNAGTALDARTNAGDYSSTDNLKGYWKMEDGSGTTLTDVSGYGNDGTIDGASWTTGVLSTSYDNTPKSIESEAPVTPTGLKATPTSDRSAWSNKEITLTWSANSESDLAQYNVYGGTTSSPTTLLSTVSSGTETYTQTSLSRGETFYYRISAVDNSGNESDKTSDAASGLVSHVTLNHSVGDKASSVGITNGGSLWVASRWVHHRYELNGIGSANNLYLSKITFYPNGDSTTYKLHAWAGDMSAYPTTNNVVMTQEISPTIGQLNEIEISSPKELDVTKMFSFGVYADQPAGEYPIGIDEGPAYKGYGDLYSTDVDGNAFSSLGDAGLDGNPILIGQFIDKDDVFVESLTVDFTKETNVESSTLTSGQSYYLRVTGAFGVASGDNRDAAYDFDNSTPEQASSWKWNGTENYVRPSPDNYNIHHVYYYYFTGDGTTEKFSFSDTGYGDNKGSLKIEIWENK